MTAPSLTLRPATLDDAVLLHLGRNAPLVRAWSLQGEEIAWEQHFAWLQATLANPDRQLLIGEAGVPRGVLRYDRMAGNASTATVSIYLLPDQGGQGWGGRLLQAGDRRIAALWPQLRSLLATVRTGNVASLQLFRRAGYEEVAVDGDEHRFILRLMPAA